VSVYCDRYCSHGGRCGKAPGHAPPHVSGFSEGQCVFTDAESLGKEAADAALRRQPGGAEYLDGGEDQIAGMFESFLGDGETE
jgi:hypothetical protein